MTKVATQYYKTDPWNIIEEGFSPSRGKVSESIFTLSNEYIGIRGFFEESYGGESLRGVYINDVYESNTLDPKQVPGLGYKGISKRSCFMINTVNFLKVRIILDEEELDLSKSQFEDFKRVLDLKTGELTRSFIWETNTGKRTQITFKRLVHMEDTSLVSQRIEFQAINHNDTILLETDIDFTMKHESADQSFIQGVINERKGPYHYALGETIYHHEQVFIGAHMTINRQEAENISKQCKIHCKEGENVIFEKSIKVSNRHNQKGKNFFIEEKQKLEQGKQSHVRNYEKMLRDNQSYWAGLWEKSDIEILGSDLDQQGIRYCIFQLNQAYQGKNEAFNIGAKGLTGEAYNGHAFWDTETGCLPYYLYNNHEAAKSLLMFRYKGLEAAKERAKELDCEGACYPIATKDGTESCNLWQHASTQIQPSTGVAYGIWHYDKIIGDKQFLYNEGIEMLIEICRFLATRGQWSQKTNKYGYFGVMGPDEFQVMVNNNMYTNYMAKRCFHFTLEVLHEMKSMKLFDDLAEKLKLKDSELKDWAQMEKEMKIIIDENGLYEQHEGFYDLPHIDIHQIPVEDFPLYHHWSYDRIYRNDMIKQPDVLMFMFLYREDFPQEIMKVNYDFYEPRCIHESSLSPAIHSIIAGDIGYTEAAANFFAFATRLDLDDYNRNSYEGLHITSIAMAWMNIIYGFAGMTVSDQCLHFKPFIPDNWEQYSFSLTFNEHKIKVTVTKEYINMKLEDRKKMKLKVYDKLYEVENEIEIRTF